MPVIQPFSFDENGINGKASTRVMCMVKSGDFPMSIRWLKDGEILKNDGSNRKTVALDDATVILSLSNLSLDDSGNYTCIASNDAGSMSHSSVLKVKGTYSSNLLVA